MKVLNFLKRIPHWYLLVGPYISLYFGMALNQLAIVANGNNMPVRFPQSAWETVCSDPTYLYMQGDVVHTCMTTATHLKFLCDWITIGNPVPEYIMSPGDLFIFLYEMAVPVALYLWIAFMVKEGMTRVVQTPVQDNRSGAPKDGAA